MFKRRGMFGVLAVAALLWASAPVSAWYWHWGEPIKDFAFQRLAWKDISPDEDKLAAVEQMIARLIDEISTTTGMEVAVGRERIGEGFQYRHRLSYFQDPDLDGEPDEFGQTVEVRFSSDTLSLASKGARHGIAYPLGVLSVFTQADSIQVFAAVPETIIRVFFRDVRSDLLRHKVRKYRKRLEQVVHTALEDDFDTCVQEDKCDEEGYGPELTDANLEAIGAFIRSELEPLFMLGDVRYALDDYRYVAPSVTLHDVTAREVIAAVEEAALDGTADSSAGLPDVLWTAFGAAAANGDFSPLSDVLEAVQAENGAWSKGKALEKWEAVRTLRLSRPWQPSTGNVYFLQLCAPRYATTSLSAVAGFFDDDEYYFANQLALPCGLLVQERQSWWHEGLGLAEADRFANLTGDRVVNLHLLNTAVVFPTYFSNALGRLQEIAGDPSQPDGLRQAAQRFLLLFTYFPLITYNDLASVVNFEVHKLDPDADELPLYVIPTPLP